MSEIRKKGFEINRALPFLALAGMGLGLSLLAIDPDTIKKFLRNEYRSTFDNLLRNSNEKEEVDMAIENLPEGSEQGVAKWMNDALEAKRRAIAKGHIRPHHVMHIVLMNALSLTNRSKK